MATLAKSRRRKSSSVGKRGARGKSTDTSRAARNKQTSKVAKASPSGKHTKSRSSAIRTFKTARDFLNSLVNFERRPPQVRTGTRGVYTLTRMKKLLADLDHPERAFRTVHIGGTKGKGSTATMLAAMLRNNDLRVGLYTSPHVTNIRERISINGELIGETAFVRTIARIAGIVSKYKSDKPTFFEIMTAAAFEYFRDKKVDIAVVEVGLGGRYDATNVIRPEVCGITSISKDHVAQLGDSLKEIAGEKAGIFKPDIPVVSAPQEKEARDALRAAAEKTNSPLLFAGTQPGDEIEFSYRFESSRAIGPQARICISTPGSHYDHLAVPLVGEHQAINCGVAMGLLDQLKQRGLSIDDEKAIAGLATVEMRGRMEMVCERPRVLVDVAHNAASVEALMRAIGQNIASETMVVIFGCCQDKDLRGMLRQLQLGADKVIFTRARSPRAADPDDLATLFADVSGQSRMAQVARTLREALEIAEKAVTREDLICVTGSFYLVAEAKGIFANHPHRPQSTPSPVS